LFYILGTFIIGLLVSSDDKRLGNSSGTAASSPFVIAIEDAGIPVLPSIINACLLTSAWSAASSDLYTSSRALFGLSVSGSAPKVFRKVNKFGLPYLALLVSVAFSLLAYMAVSQNAWTVFNYFGNMTSICGLITWLCIAITYIRFDAGIKKQNIDRSILPYKSPLGAFGGWYVLISLSIILFFSGWEVFLAGHWDTSTFITTYLPIPFAFILYFGYKLVKRTKVIPTQDIDFVTGVREFDEEDEEPATTVLGKFFNAL
jgi:amino acid transporter